MITPSENNKFQNVFLNLNSSRFSLSIFSLVAVSACRSPYILQNDLGGAVIKGPLENALVFLDYNFNGIIDEKEPFTRTNTDGTFNIVGLRGYSFQSQLMTLRLTLRQEKFWLILC